MTSRRYPAGKSKGWCLIGLTFSAYWTAYCPWPIKQKLGSIYILPMQPTKWVKFLSWNVIFFIAREVDVLTLNIWCKWVWPKQKVCSGLWKNTKNAEFMGRRCAFQFLSWQRLSFLYVQLPKAKHSWFTYLVVKSTRCPLQSYACVQQGSPPPKYKDGQPFLWRNTFPQDFCWGLHANCGRCCSQK